jgi:pimeloyl-ACP methyl ester carboxylesterase
VTNFWLGVTLLCSMPVAVLGSLVILHFYLRFNYLHLVIRIFQEKPLFIIPRGQPVADAEDVTLSTSDGISLRGCYLTTPKPRKGVILFGLEFGSSRWSCLPYCEHLLDSGYDVFALECRGQGDSDDLPGYEPLQWVTHYEVEDMHMAIAYLQNRPDADPRGIGFFGISKGAGAGILAAVRDPYVRCFVTDGMFACYTTLVPYIRQWFRIYDDHYMLQGLLPSWYFGWLGLAGLHSIEKERGCRFAHLERGLSKLGSRPLLMIHGGADTYIKPEMTRNLFKMIHGPKELWLVEGAKHNQALQVAGEEYRQRVVDFFDKNLGEFSETLVPSERGDFVASASSILNSSSL